jgi:hypothetical protein
MKDYKGNLYLCLIVGITSFIFSDLKTGALILGIIYAANIIIASKDHIAFREYTLGIYALNYLLSPAILYDYNDADFMFYKMKCSEEVYFTNAILGILALHFGLFLIKVKVFNLDFSLSGIQAKVNAKVFKTWLYSGLLLYISFSYVSVAAEVSIFLLILSNIRFLGAFALLSLDSKKYIYHVLVVFGFETSYALGLGFFHDLLIWYIFFGLYIVYIKKISLFNKLVLTLLFITLAYSIQILKSDYRDQLWNSGQGDETIENLSMVTNKKKEEGTYLSKETMLTTLIRVNQGWIAASAIDKADRTGEFAGTELLYKYIEAAILPRFLAPNKLKAGDKEVFNKYSGHTIREGTSMGLGVIADGYIAFKTLGVVLYCFGLGLIFNLIFLLVDKWAQISPFFGLMLFPILYYGVRPDCELQVTLGQLIKGTFTFWLVTRFYKNYFAKQTKIMQRIEMMIQKRKEEMIRRYLETKKIKA